MASTTFSVVGIVSRTCRILCRNESLIKKRIHTVVTQASSNRLKIGIYPRCKITKNSNPFTSLVQQVQHTSKIQSPVISSCTRNIYSSYFKTCSPRSCLSFFHQRYCTSASQNLDIPQNEPTTITVSTASNTGKIRPRRKKKGSNTQVTEDTTQNTSNKIREISACATAEQYRLDDLRKAIVKDDLYKISDLPTDMAALCVHVTANYTAPSEDEMREIFFFKEGIVVFWEVDKRERDQVLKLLRTPELAKEIYDEKVTEKYVETLDWKLSGKRSNLNNGVIQLNQALREGQRVSEMYAFSHALAKSVKLHMFEDELEEINKQTEDIRQAIRLGKVRKSKRKKALVKLGEIHHLRYRVNLSSDLLDTPDVYWERDKLADFYQKLCRHLDTLKRTRVINEKLNYCVDLIELFKDQLNDNRHVLLECLIILLIVIEVFFEFMHYGWPFVYKYLHNILYPEEKSNS